MFGFEAHIKKVQSYNRWCELQEIIMTSTGKTQNRCATDVDHQTRSPPTAKGEASSCCVVLVKEQQPDSTTKPDVRPKDTTFTAPKAGIEFTMEELLVPRALQAFFWWVGGMMKYVPECTQIRALNAAKSTICDVLSEVMVTMTTPPGMETGFAQPVMATPTQLPQNRDV